jgi:hypothetical protein
MRKFITPLLTAAAFCFVARIFAAESSLGATNQAQSHVTGTNTDVQSPSLDSRRTPAPLPTGYLLGASSLQEREDICEAVFRYVATRRRDGICFVGFENIVEGRTVRHDPTDEVLKRLRDLGPSVKPASQAKDARNPDGTIP